MSDLGSSWPSCLEIFDLYVFILFEVFLSVSTFFVQIKDSFYICCYFNLSSRNCNSETRHLPITWQYIYAALIPLLLLQVFSKFYRRHFDIVSKYNVGLKTLLLQGFSEPEFYGDLVYKFRKIIGNNDSCSL